MALKASIDARRVSLACVASLTVAVHAASARQVPVPDAGQPARPSFDSGTGPVIAIDEAHKNTHTYGTPSFRGLVELLQRDGYRVAPFTERIAAQSLTRVDLLILSGPGGWVGGDASLNAQEVGDLVEWIRNGGSLLLILGHMPDPRHAGRLLTALGIDRWHDGYAMVEVQDSLVGPINFWRADLRPTGQPTLGPTGPRGGMGYQGADAVLAKHSITEGRSAAERVRRVATFVGSAFQLPPGAEGILTMPRGAVSLTPPETPGAVPSITTQTPRIPVGGWWQGAVLRLGRGRVALFGDTALFSGGPAADNRSFVLNVMHWLSGLL